MLGLRQTAQGLTVNGAEVAGWRRLKSRSGAGVWGQGGWRRIRLSDFVRSSGLRAQNAVCRLAGEHSSDEDVIATSEWRAGLGNVCGVN